MNTTEDAEILNFIEGLFYSSFSTKKYIKSFALQYPKNKVSYLIYKFISSRKWLSLSDESFIKDYESFIKDYESYLSRGKD